MYGDENYDDEENFPINRPGRSPEYSSFRVCPQCGRRLVYLVADRLYYCYACEREYGNLGGERGDTFDDDE